MEQTDQQFAIGDRVCGGGHTGSVMSAQWVEARYTAGWVYWVKLDAPIEERGREIDRLVFDESELRRE